MLRRARALAFWLALAMLAPAAQAQSAGGGEDLSSPRQIEAAFLVGLYRLEHGDPKGAVVLFRRILAKNPDLPRVRLELARAYFALESWAQSREQFVAVLSSGVPAPVKANILKFINAIDARRGFDWNASIGVSLGPQSGRSYKSDTVDLDFLGIVLPFKVKRPSNDSIGVAFEGGAELRQPLFDFGEGGPAVLGFVTGAVAGFEGDGAQSDAYAVNGAVGARAVWPQTSASLALNAGARQQIGEVYEDRHGLAGVLEYRTETGFAPIALASYSAVNVHDREAQDGDQFNLGGGFSKSVFGWGQVGAILSAERFDARRDYESYDALQLTLDGKADLGAGFGATLRASVRRSRYDAKIPLFLEKRADTEVDVDLELVKTDLYLFGQFSPFVRVGYTWNDSTLDIFSYEEYRALIGIRNAF